MSCLILGQRDQVFLFSRPELGGDMHAVALPSSSSLSQTASSCACPRFFTRTVSVWPALWGNAKLRSASGLHLGQYDLQNVACSTGTCMAPAEVQVSRGF